MWKGESKRGKGRAIFFHFRPDATVQSCDVIVRQEEQQFSLWTSLWLLGSANNDVMESFFLNICSRIQYYYLWLRGGSFSAVTYALSNKLMFFLTDSLNFVKFIRPGQFLNGIYKKCPEIFFSKFEFRCRSKRYVQKGNFRIVMVAVI